MAEDLSRLWGNLSLREDEDSELEILNRVPGEVDHRSKLCIVGKLIADRWISKETIRAKLIRGWKPEGSLSFKVLGENLFLIEFEYSSDKERVLKGRPWAVEGSLFLVEDYDGTTPPNRIDFESVVLWVRMINLPLSGMVKDVGLQIGSAMGAVEEVETDEDDIGWGKFLRVRIRMDLRKPLPRGRRVKILGRSEWVHFQYERLPRICFRCGVIKHGRGGCTLQGPPGGEPQYGPWLRAPSPTKRYQTKRGWQGGLNGWQSDSEQTCYAERPKRPAMFGAGDSSSRGGKYSENMAGASSEVGCEKHHGVPTVEKVGVTQSETASDDHGNNQGKSMKLNEADSENITDTFHSHNSSKGEGNNSHKSSKREGINDGETRGTKDGNKGVQVMEKEGFVAANKAEKKPSEPKEKYNDPLDSLQKKFSDLAAGKEKTGEHVEGIQLMSKNIFGDSWANNHVGKHVDQWAPTGKASMHAPERGGTNTLGNRGSQRSPVVTWKRRARAGQNPGANTEVPPLGENKKKRGTKGEGNDANWGKRGKIVFENEEKVRIENVSGLGVARAAGQSRRPQ
jgi:hypothetical protein